MRRHAVKDDVILHQHGYGPQDEGEEEVEVNVVPGAVQLPVDSGRQSEGLFACVKVELQDVH